MTIVRHGQRSTPQSSVESPQIPVAPDKRTCCVSRWLIYDLLKMATENMLRTNPEKMRGLNAVRSCLPLTVIGPVSGVFRVATWRADKQFLSMSDGQKIGRLVLFYYAVKLSVAMSQLLL